MSQNASLGLSVLGELTEEKCVQGSVYHPVSLRQRLFSIFFHRNSGQASRSRVIGLTPVMATVSGEMSVSIDNDFLKICLLAILCRISWSSLASVKRPFTHDGLLLVQT